MAIQILDGAIGTELILRGIRLEGPQWSAHAIFDAPEALAEVHADYARAVEVMFLKKYLGLK